MILDKDKQKKIWFTYCHNGLNRFHNKFWTYVYTYRLLIYSKI